MIIMCMIEQLTLISKTYVRNFEIASISSPCAESDIKLKKYSLI